MSEVKVKTDAEIDQVVSQMFGLTEGERVVIEDCLEVF